MGGAIVMCAWLMVAGKAIDMVTDHMKAKYPEKVKQYRILFAAILCLLYGVGIAFSVMVGGWVNGAQINAELVLLALKCASFIMLSAIGIVLLLKFLGNGGHE